MDSGILQADIMRTAATPGSFDIVAGHVQGKEVANGVLEIKADGSWQAAVTLKHHHVASNHVGSEREAEVTLMSDLCAWTGRATITSSDPLTLQGRSLELQPAVGA